MNQSEFMISLLAAISGVVLTLIGGLAKHLTKKLNLFLEQKGLADVIKSKKYLVDIAVLATEQIWVNEEGEKKLLEAKRAVYALLKEEGLQISEEQLNLFIEAAVGEINKGVQEGLHKEKVEKTLIETTVIATEE